MFNNVKHVWPQVNHVVSRITEPGCWISGILFVGLQGRLLIARWRQHTKLSNAIGAISIRTSCAWCLRTWACEFHRACNYDWSNLLANKLCSSSDKLRCCTVTCSHCRTWLDEFWGTLMNQWTHNSQQTWLLKLQNMITVVQLIQRLLPVMLVCASIASFITATTNMRSQCLSCLTAWLTVPLAHAYDWSSPALNQTQHNLIPNTDGSLLYYNGTGNVPSYQEYSQAPNPITPINRYEL